MFCNRCKKKQTKKLLHLHVLQDVACVCTCGCVGVLHGRTLGTWTLPFISAQLQSIPPTIQPSIQYPSLVNVDLRTVHTSPNCMYAQCQNITSSKFVQKPSHWLPLTLPALHLFESCTSCLGCTPSMMSLSRLPRLPRRLYGLAEIRRKGSDVICRGLRVGGFGGWWWGG